MCNFLNLLIYSNKNKTFLIRYPKNNKATEFIVPDVVEEIKDNAFGGCDKLKEITISEGVTTIGDEAFSYCTGIRKVIMPQKSLKYIGEFAFDGCYEVVFYVYKGSSVEEILKEMGEQYIYIDAQSNKCGEDATWSVNGDTLTISGKGRCWDYWYKRDVDMTKIKKVVFEEGITCIGEKMFFDCNQLTSVSIPDSVDAIRDYAFAKCTNLKDIQISAGNKTYSVMGRCLYNKEQTEIYHYISGAICNIPAQIEYIYPSALFYYADELEQINVDENNQIYSSVNGALYSKDKTELVCYPRAAKELSLAKETVILRSGSVENCKNLISVEIPEGIKNIESDVFNGCTALKEVILPRNLSYLSRDAFGWWGSENRVNPVIYVYKPELFTAKL